MSALQLIPLNKLVESEDNVRRTERKRDIDTLAASIAAHGLLQNLTVTAREDGKFAVVAGARRHAALKLLVRQGERPKDWPTPCQVVASASAAEASLAENVQRVEMNAMDEVEAFAALIAAGQSPEDVAQRFGTTLRHVEQRLALAHLSPRIRAAYRRGELTLDVARAFCIGDHEAQERVFKGLAKPITSAHAVRGALTQGRTPLSDRLALFVGVDAYTAAGGRIVKDLFEDTIAFLEDGEILQRLALEKAEALRDALLADGWGWAELNLAGGHLEGFAAERLRPGERKLTAKEKRRLAAVDAEIERIDSELEGIEDGPEADALWDRREALDGERDAIAEAARIYDPALMAHAGAIVGVDRDGKPTIQRGLIRRADLKALDKLRSKAKAGEDSGEDDADEGAPAGASLSKALTRDLTLARTRAIRAGVASDVHVALALLVCTLAQQSAGSGDLVGPEINATARDFGDDEVFATLRSARTFPETFIEALALDDETLLSCLAILVAETIDLHHEGASAQDRERQRSADAIAAAIRLDMSAHWSPDSAFWQRTSKQYALDALAEGSDFADLPEAKRSVKLKALAKLKKHEFADAAAKAFAQSRWLPDCLVTPLGEGALALTNAAEASLAAQH
ncbi:ParB/RepB/Spo0J family partition protein [Vitreimonas flagellata]|uniref:ParB/RepB/Spo0J family partition protein n=1 Tax=Vitreimonas flagellata TaxID=2560861 RepID=UPI001074DB59|nr:ParB/RepB/Spo0J family partition protein [Vitreimonas flagellata]